jgi:hypothetical protein
MTSASRPRIAALLGTAVLLVLLPFGEVGALQTAPLPELRGTVSDATSGAPVVGALVRLVDPEGTPLPPRLTGTGGSYRLQAPAPGQYQVQVERIGYRSTRSDPVELTSGPPVELALAMEMEPLTLAGITVEGSQRCRVAREISQEAARLWEEARRALYTTALTSEDEILRFRLTRWRRELDPVHLTIRTEERSQEAGAAANPIQSLPAEELQREGYVRPLPDGTHLYFAPDARVLLSDAFMDDHCFTVQEGRGENRGLVGLGFQPVPGRTVPDVEGVLWLDRESAELRHLELRHTWHPWRLPTTRNLGARVDFEGLPSGAWIVRRWWIRMPMAGMIRSRFQDRELESIDLVGILEEGGEISEIRTRDTTVAQAPGAVLSGVVMDSSAVAASEGVAGPPRPLAGARVALSGTSYGGETDAEGRFRLEGLPEGSYRAFLIHPRLDSLGINSPGVDIAVGREGEAEIHLALPSAPTLLRGHCPELAPRAAALVGQVLEGDDRPARGARVEVSWSSFDLPAGSRAVWIREDVDGIAVPVDSRGRFHLCDVPGEVTLRLRAVVEVTGVGGERREVASPVVQVSVPEGGLAARVLRLAPP